jgi:hypothetical protein
LARTALNGWSRSASGKRSKSSERFNNAISARFSAAVGGRVSSSVITGQRRRGRASHGRRVKTSFDSHWRGVDDTTPGAAIWEFAVLVTSLDMEIRSLAQLYRDRGDSENPFDELKNQWGWAGFTTADISRCQLMARLIALIYNWWSLYSRLADPNQHHEALTTRSLLLNAVARQTRHGGPEQVTLGVRTGHGHGQGFRQAPPQHDDPSRPAPTLQAQLRFMAGPTLPGIHPAVAPDHLFDRLADPARQAELEQIRQPFLLAARHIALGPPILVAARQTGPVRSRQRLEQRPQMRLGILGGVPVAGFHHDVDDQANPQTWKAW